VHAALQHTPSVQTLLTQSLLALQPAPLASLVPQELVVLRQVSPATQFASVVHVVRQEVPLQT
jgi:hypothetical protein